jgi:hypothetical protein
MFLNKHVYEYFNWLSKYFIFLDITHRRQWSKLSKAKTKEKEQEMVTIRQMMKVERSVVPETLDSHYIVVNNLG